MGKNKRIFELDALRGIAVILMICHHFMWDVRYVLKLDLFSFQEGDFFNYFLQPFFVCVFVMISGICCVLSRNNLVRSLRLFVAAIVVSVVTAIASLIMLKTGEISSLSRDGLFVFFNVIHLLTVGTFICWIVQMIEHKVLLKRHTEEYARKYFSELVTGGLIVAGALIVLFVPLVEKLSYRNNIWIFLPIGILPDNIISMGDYLPMVPWLGVFLIGISVGRTMYAEKKSAFPGTPAALRKISVPFEFVGRNAIWFYLIHWPVIKAILIAGRHLGLF